MENPPVSLKIIIDDFQNGLHANYGQEEIMQFIYLLVEEKFGWSKTDVHLNHNRKLKGEEESFLREALDQLKNNKPVQYITGVTHFLDVIIQVREGVLIPRPETEELTAMILKDMDQLGLQNISLLDIGTGSGCIPVAIKKRSPLSNVTATDISAEALKIADENARLNKCHVNFILSDILDRELWSQFLSYSIIVSNPPYIPSGDRVSMHPNVVNSEPHTALFVPDEDPLVFYSAICEFAFLHLLRPGFLYFEINERFGGEIMKMLLLHGFESVEIVKDIHGKDRFVRAELIPGTSYS